MIDHVKRESGTDTAKSNDAYEDNVGRPVSSTGQHLKILDGEKAVASESFDDVRSFITNQMGSLIRLNGSEGSLMFKTKIENLSSDVRQKRRHFQRHPASMT